MAARNDVLVLVVDDQLDRQRVYEDCLRAVNKALGGKWILDVRFCADLGSAAAVARRPGQRGLAVVDMVLDTDAWPSASVNLLDQRLLAEQWPMLLVSARFDEAAALDRANKLLADMMANSVPFQFVLWSTIEQGATSEVLAHQITFIVNAIISGAYGQNLEFSKEPDTPIDILHITDPHFGKATWSAGALMTLKAKLGNRGLVRADFVAVTGDIANSGAPSQYGLASAYLHAIAHNGLVSSANSRRLSGDRVLLCPGNHDFSRPVALGANIAFKAKYSVQPKPVPENSWVRELAWDPYLNFEREIAGHGGRWISTPGYRVNSSFANTGVIFLELNVERYEIDGYQEGASDIDVLGRFNQAAAQVAEVRREGECLVVLAHRHESDGWSALGQMFSSVLAGFAAQGPVVLLCGHDHSAKIMFECDERVLVIRGVPPTEGPSRSNLTLPTIHYVRLSRAGGRVESLTVHKFRQETTKWLDDETPRTFAWVEHAGWCKAA